MFQGNDPDSYVSRGLSDSDVSRVLFDPISDVSRSLANLTSDVFRGLTDPASDFSRGFR